MAMLCQELANEQNPPDTRKVAGIAFKNALTAKVHMGIMQCVCKEITGLY
jgi:hypothetical protein